MEERTQLNTRVRPEYKRAAKFSAGVIGTSLDSLSEIMIRVLLGQEDAETKRAREKVAKAWKAVGEKLPFKVTLIQTVHNAVLTSRGDSASVTNPDGVVAQLVEHHNGINADMTPTTRPAQMALPLLNRARKEQYHAPQSLSLRVSVVRRGNKDVSRNKAQFKQTALVH